MKGCEGNRSRHATVQAMLTSDEIFTAINSLERRFPVAAWKAGDIDLWPSYRFRLYGNAMNALFSNAPAGGPARRIGALLKRVSRAVFRVPIAMVRDSGANQRLQRGTTAIFFSDGASFVHLDEAWVDRVMDPVIEALAERGRRSYKLTPLAEAHVPRRVPSRFVQPSIDRIKMLASGSSVCIETPEFTAFHSAAIELLGESALPSREWLHIEAARLSALAKWFGEIIRRSGASHAFVNTYYSLEGLAFTLAARRAGARTVDLQHGIQGPHHVAYARWASVPQSGFSTVPDEFWVWGDVEARAIESWRADRETHVPRITGNFWLQRWRDGSNPEVAKYLLLARSMCSDVPGVRHVLACLTNGVPDEENNRLVRAARLCGESVRWWWRLHPTQAHRRAEFARLVESEGLDGSQVGLATDLPLFSLMPLADVLVAHSSTVIAEATEFGLRSVITSDYGVELHAALVEKGLAVPATSIEGIAAAVCEVAAAHVPVDRNLPTHTPSLKSVMDATFGPPTS
jgi:hypothetical protein